MTLDGVDISAKIEGDRQTFASSPEVQELLEETAKIQALDRTKLLSIARNRAAEVAKKGNGFHFFRLLTKPPCMLGEVLDVFVAAAREGIPRWKFPHVTVITAARNLEDVSPAMEWTCHAHRQDWEFLTTENEPSTIEKYDVIVYVRHIF